MGINDAIAELCAVLGEGVTLSKSELTAHGRSETHFPLMPPDAVAYPRSTEDVMQIVSICARHKCPVVGWGAGTSLEGQAQAVRGGICVDFQHMNRVLNIRPGDQDVTVQPGVTREALNEELRATGLFFPVDPGANASIGGMASTRASGTTAVRYGTMRDSVLALEVVTASGEVIRTGTRARKSSAGYDLTGLFVGAEGTLGLITELTLRLQGTPEAVSSAVCAFASVNDAVAATMDAIQMGLPLARIELMDSDSVIAVNSYSSSKLPVKPHLLLEFHGTEATVADQSAIFGQIAAEHEGQGFSWATKTEDRNALWAMRHNAYHAILQLRPGARAIVTDICVPISRLAEAVETTRSDLAHSNLTGPILGHVGDGNFHAVLLIDETDADEVARAKAASSRMVELALSLGGTSSGEHGIGMGKLEYMAQEHGGAWAMMGTLKRALDPDNIMNPGKLVPPVN
ncbi:MAG: FAD-linked oxidase C-terminal domain-containing protein [Roseovarius sp.]|nr:FAD-linked oxidase C-terminal domain-containing protein [Roseovarius sp.]